VAPDEGLPQGRIRLSAEPRAGRVDQPLRPASYLAEFLASPYPFASANLPNRLAIASAGSIGTG
jgi:hypothetical protein